MQLFVLLFLLSHVAMVTALSGCHRDRDKDHRPRENCTAAGFSDVPAGFEPSTKVLLFPNNLFSSLSWSSFQIFTEIYEIDLTGNKVPEVISSVSLILPSLSVLRLGSNQLTSLSAGSFSACPALTELYLDNNAIESLSDHTFSGLSKLEILDLSSNRIKVLPELMLHPLPAIETLLLEKNKIKVMPDDWFSQKEEVPYLYLSDNPWACPCSLGYLRRYLDDYELNVYVRDGPLIKSDAESVVCDSPQWHKGTPVMSLEESDLCSPATESPPTGDYEQVIADTPDKRTTAATTVPTTNIPPPPPPPPTATAPPVPITTTPPAPASTATPAFAKELHTESHRVVTRSWYHTFTRRLEWSNYSGSVVKSDVLLVGSPSLATRSTLPTVRPSTERLTDMTTTTPTKPGTSVGSLKFQAVTTTAAIPSWAISEPGSQRRGGAAGGAGLFCVWLFAGCLLLCVASAACILVTLVRLVIWYRRVYRPLSVALTRRGRGNEGVRLLPYSRKEEREVGGGGGGVTALYRSVLFIQREEGEDLEKEDRGKEGKEGGGGGGGEGKERLLIALEPTGGGGVTRGEEGERGGRDERGMYRKTMYRLVSKVKEVEGWRDVMEECWVPAEDGGGEDEGMERERSGRGVSRKRYSVILREERTEARGGREEMDWVVGEWEVEGGGGGRETRSSWGEWLTHALPSMPWGVTTPPEGEAAQ